MAAAERKPRFGLLPVERAVTNMPTRIIRDCDFQPNLRGVDRGIENRQMLSTRLKPYRIGVQRRSVLTVRRRRDRFRKRPDDPDIRKVGIVKDSEHPTCTPTRCDLLVGDHPEIGAKISTTPKGDLCRYREAATARGGV